MIRSSILGLLMVLVLCLYSCKDKKSSVDVTAINLLRGDIKLCGNGEFGKVDFPFSCNPSIRETFDLGISLLHSFEYDEAEKAFVKVIDADPDCAMAYWGVAMSNFHSLWIQTGTEYLEKGSKILKAAEALPQSERERDYLEAIGAFYHGWETVNRPTRIALFEQKMEAIYKKYPTDREAAIFYALSLCATADPADKTYRNQLKSGKILESLLELEPDHPGIAHYIIHNYDCPELAHLALPMARNYAKIAPASAHAQHMPSHIFTRLGLWEESIQSNLNSTAAALCYSESLNPNAHWDEELHGMDYLVYAYLQIGDNKKANEQYEYLKTFKEVFPADFKIAYTTAAIPARIALENRDWKQAAHLELPGLQLDWNKFPWQKSIYHFARALGALHLNDKESARNELYVMKSLYQQLLDMQKGYEANQVQIQIKMIEAWMEWSIGNKNKAIDLMTEATTMENNTAKHPVTPGEVLPAGELLGDILLKCNKWKEALQAYENNLRTHPNRFNGIYGAAKAALVLGDKEKALMYFKKLIDIAKSVNSERPEIQEAKSFVNAII